MVILDEGHLFFRYFICVTEQCARQDISLSSRCTTRRPLSPLLFILAADLLQSVINEAQRLGHLKLPVPVNYSQDFPILQYADDTLVIMEVCSQQLAHLKQILDIYATSTILRVNYSKSMMVPINLSDGRCAALSQAFGCSVG